MFLYQSFVSESAKWNTVAVDSSDKPNNRYVLISIGDLPSASSNSEEAYELTVLSEPAVITITGKNTSGAFYGIQTLLSLSSQSSQLPETKVVDYPRFPYRGMHLDVGRNFRSKEEVFKLLDIMAMYKLNNLYFHLTEDEGWRIEIDGLPELTTVKL